MQPVILATTSRSPLFQAMTEEILENDGVLCRPARSCVLCGQEGETAYGGLRDRLFAAPGVWSIRWCGGCRLAWLDPRPLAAEVSKLYREYYTHSQEGTNPHWVRDLKQFLKKATLRVWLGYSDSEPDLLQWLVGAALGMVPAVRDIVELSVMCLPGSSRGRLLDVGCGSGLFLSAMRRLGWEVSGVEPDPAPLPTPPTPAAAWPTETVRFHIPRPVSVPETSLGGTSHSAPRCLVRPAPFRAPHLRATATGRARYPSNLARLSTLPS